MRDCDAKRFGSRARHAARPHGSARVRLRLVVLYHFRVDILALMPRSEPLRPLMDSGYAGVDLFFVLSGFIIAYTYAASMRQPDLARSVRFGFRLARIYPVHVATLLVFTVIITPGGAAGVRPSDIWDNLTETNQFLWQISLLTQGPAGTTRGTTPPGR